MNLRGSDTCPVLLPVFDLANHDPSAKVEWCWASTHCTLAVEEEIGSGKEIFNNYGPKGNEERKYDRCRSAPLFDNW